MKALARPHWLTISLLVSFMACAPFLHSCAAEISRLWLTPTSSSPLRVTVNWETAAPGNSAVEFGATPELGQRVALDNAVTLHHVEITPPRSDAPCFYRVQTGSDVSAVASFQPAGETTLRIAVVANLANLDSRWGEAVGREHPNLLVTGGDNVPQLHGGRPVEPDTTSAYSRLIARFPQLFRSTLFLPVLGNHDKEIRPRGTTPPETPVYDIAATAFREFFPLPTPGWRWQYDVPEFGIGLVALDLHHVSDVGTTWQSSHPFQPDSEQFNWFRDLVAKSRQPFLVTFYNERHAAVRGLGGGEWWRSIVRGSMAITGFGHFGERAEIDNVPCFNTSVRGTGDRYPDPHSKFVASEDNYLLLTFVKGSDFTVQLKNLDGRSLDAVQVSPRTLR